MHFLKEYGIIYTRSITKTYTAYNTQIKSQVITGIRGYKMNISSRMTETTAERMTVEHYTELIDLLHEKITRLERDKDEQRKEINRLKAELKKASKDTGKDNERSETE